MRNRYLASNDETVLRGSKNADFFEIEGQLLNLRRRERFRQRAIGFLVGCSLSMIPAFLVDMQCAAEPVDVLLIAIAAFCAVCVIIRD